MHRSFEEPAVRMLWGGLDTLLGGSWDLVNKVIGTLFGVISSY